MPFPKISIVTPSYNSKSLIADTIQSVLDQKYPNLEYIIIDGGSSDGTVQVIEQYETQLSYWHSKKDNGQYDAINQGFAKSSGEIMCWLNADDMLLPKSLFVVAEIFQQHTQLEWLSSLQPATWDAKGRLADVRKLPGFSRQAFLDGLYLPTTAKKGYWMQQESTFWRRSLWNKVGSSIPSYQLAGDFALWCNFYEHSELAGVNYPLGGFRMIQGQRSEDHRNYMKEAILALTKTRKNLQWTSSAASPILYSKFNATPPLNDFIKKSFGYEGIFLVNDEPKSLSLSSWQIHKAKFLP